MFRITLLAGCALPCLLLPLTATAQDRPRTGTPDVVVTGERDTLTVPDTAAATVAIRRTPGGVALIPDSAFKDTPVQTIKDVLDYVPGVVTQARMGDDARVSIRGSGLSRAYGVRGISFYLDGVPLNTSDGLMDFFEIDPTAYRYVEVYKGANALRFGANSLGGAINLVTPTGRDAAPFEARLDAGSFGYVKGQASTGGASDALDWFATVSASTNDGYRDHAGGTAVRANANLGWRVSPTLETRFYLTAATTRQRIPGEVTKAQALDDPRSANAYWVFLDQQRNVDSIRVSNKTAALFGDTRLEFGGFYNHRHVKHPIYQWLDFTVDDYGGFARATDERTIGSLRNRLILGVQVDNGTIDTRQYLNVGDARKGDLVFSAVDTSTNVSAYGEDTLHLLPAVSLVAGVQYLHARRDRRDRFLADGNQSGAKTFDLWSPKLGLLWDVDASTQVYANVSRSAEVPTYDANTFASPASADLDAQRATTYEIGTRGRQGRVGWDVSLYRAELRDELQCLTTSPFSLCTAVNLGRTVHQGVEAGVAADLIRTDSGTLALNAAWTYNDFHFDGDTTYGDNRLPGVPEHLIRAELLYKHASGVYAGPNVEWSPKRYYADDVNSEFVPSYALLNLKLGVERGGWTGYVEGRNLTNKRYIATVAIAGTADAASEIYNPGVGRAVFAGVRRQFR